MRKSGALETSELREEKEVTGIVQSRDNWQAFNACEKETGSEWEKVTSELNKILHKLQADHISIPEFTFHALRHTFAIRGLEQGISLRIMQAILGHTTLAMTSDLYSHVLPTTKAREMEKMEAVFR